MDGGGFDGYGAVTSCGLAPEIYCRNLYTVATVGRSAYTSLGNCADAVDPQPDDSQLSTPLYSDTLMHGIVIHHSVYE